MAVFRVRRRATPVVILPVATEPEHFRSLMGILPVGGQPAAAAAPADDAAKTTPAAGASTTSSAGADVWALALGLLLVAVGWWLFATVFTPAKLATVAQGVGIFGLIYIAAQGLERGLEPFASFDPKKKDLVQKRDKAAAAADTGSGDAADAAEKQAKLDVWRADRTLILWGVATLLGMGLSSTFGIYLLNIAIATPQGGSAPNQTLDILITGLVIGGGTKPLHDLITRIQVSKDTAQDASASGTASG